MHKNKNVLEYLKEKEKNDPEFAKNVNLEYEKLEKVRILKEKFKEISEKRSKENLVVQNPPPRYDEIFFEGMEQLDNDFELEPVEKFFSGKEFLLYMESEIKKDFMNIIMN
jgi:hypothetical protein